MDQRNKELYEIRRVSKSFESWGVATKHIPTGEETGIIAGIMYLMFSWPAGLEVG